VVGKLGEAGLSKGDRYAFSLVTTGVTSSKDWTEADAASILFWLDEGGAEHAQRVANAVVHVLFEAGLDIKDVEQGRPLAAGKRRMEKLLESQRRKETGMSINVAALVNSASKWGYQGGGDVLRALGVEDINDFDGTIADALRILESKAGGAEPVAPEQEAAPAPPVEDEAEVEKEPVDAAFLAQYREEIDSMPEAPVLAWTRFQRRPGSPTWTISIRAGLSPECQAFALRETLGAIAKFDRYIYDNEFAAVLDGRDQAAFPVARKESAPSPAPTQAPRQSAGTAPPPPTPPQASAGAGGPPPAVAGGNGTSDQDEIVTYQVMSIERDKTSKGDNSYRVKGPPPYHKFGVMGYEDVEQSVATLGFDVSQLEIKAAWDCSDQNWVAHAWKPAGEKFAKRVNEIVAG